MSAARAELDVRVTPAMLAIVDPNSVVAAARYRKLVTDLSRSLEWHGCRDAEGVAGESVYRALKKLSEGADTAKSGLRAFIFGIAKLVLKEGWKVDRRERQLEPEIWERRPSTLRDHERTEAELMLRQVQRLVSQEQWQMLFRYCTERDHTAQSRELDVTPGYLRVMIHRIRDELRAKALPERERDAPRRPARKRPRRRPATTK